MAKSLLVDADVIVDYLRGHPAAVAFIDANQERVAISTAVVAELYAGVKGEQELAFLDELVSACMKMPVTFEIARLGGLFKRNYWKSHEIGIVDAIVAATAQSENAELATLNVKHFPMFQGLRPPYSKS